MSDMTLFERACEGVLVYPVPSVPWNGGYDMRLFQIALSGGPILGESFGAERFANGAFFGPRLNP